VLPRLVKGVAPDRLRWIPAPGEWSIHVIVCHLALNEMNTAVSLRLILTQDRPSLAEIEDDRCAERFAALYPDTETAFWVWRALREANLGLWAGVARGDGEGAGGARGTEGDISVRRSVAGRARHDLDHLEQIRTLLGD